MSKCLYMKHLRQDKIVEHQNSDVHKRSVEVSLEAAATRVHGGIKEAFHKSQTIQKDAAIGAMKIMYRLAKQEVTNFASLIELAIYLFNPCKLPAKDSTDLHTYGLEYINILGKHFNIDNSLLQPWA